MLNNKQANITKHGISLAIVLVVILSLIEYRLVIFFHIRSLKSIIEATLGVTTGVPHWRVYQNRLLGPFSVKYLSHIFYAPYPQMYLFFTMGLHVLKNLLCFCLINRLTGCSRISLRYTLYFVVCFIFLQTVGWLYIWDYLDVIIFTMFLYGVLTHKKNWYFLLTFCLALLNKESGLFIALWMILDALIEKSDESRFYFSITSRHLRRLLLGVVLVVGGIFFVDFVRDALFVKSSVRVDSIHTGIAYGKHIHVKLLKNPTILLNNIRTPTFILNFLVNILILAVPVFIIANRKKIDDTIFKLVLILLSVYGTILVFGEINETRVYSILIPFFIFLSVRFFTQDKRDTIMDKTD